MAKYSVLVAASAKKVLSQLPKKDCTKLVSAIEILAIDPWHATGIRKLSGEENVYRLRVGRYRIIFEIKNKKELLILVLKIGHRKDVYR